MPSIKKSGRGYRAQVAVKGVRDSSTFPTRREATAWASDRERELRAGRRGDRHTLSDAIRKFQDEVCPTRRGERWEVIRLDAIQRQFAALWPAARRLDDITSARIAEWRDGRLKTHAPASVLREMGLLSSLFETARREWGWIEANPVRMLRKPSAPPHRERVLTRAEIRGVLRALGHGRRVQTMSQSAALALCLALRTGMRAGELCGLNWADVRGDYVILAMTKNGSRREVPLSVKARLVIARARGLGLESVFGLGAQTLDALFRRARARAGLKGFTFHDSRHTAATLIARRLTMLELCRMFGWHDPKHALIYFNPSASSLAARL